jgi:hypothetical protein
VKSGFKIAGILIVVCAALLVLVSYLPIHRIEAWAWHWRHGNSIQVGEFTVPVPNEWGVERFDVGGGTQEVLLANTKGGKPFGATITITEEPWRVKNMVLADLVISRQRMMANLGIHVTEYAATGHQRYHWILPRRRNSDDGNSCSQHLLLLGNNPFNRVLRQSS